MADRITCPRCEGQKYDKGSCGLCKNTGTIPAGRKGPGVYAEAILCKNKTEAARFRAEIKKLNESRLSRYAELEPMRRRLATAENAISESYCRARTRIEDRYSAWRNA
jgi:hypothetical protein